MVPFKKKNTNPWYLPTTFMKFAEKTKILTNSSSNLAICLRFNRGWISYSFAIYKNAKNNTLLYLNNNNTKYLIELDGMVPPYAGVTWLKQNSYVNNICGLHILIIIKMREVHRPNNSQPGNCKYIIKFHYQWSRKEKSKQILI